MRCDSSAPSASWDGSAPALSCYVDMTSDVKGRQQLFLGLHDVFSSVHRQSRSQSERRLLTLIAVGWRPPDLGPSGACHYLGTRV